MRDVPTLADACIATALDKRMVNKDVRELLLTVGQANKFVLDSSMSAYLADLSGSFWTGGLRKRIALLDNARRLARLPHKITWFEYDVPAFHARHKSLGVKIVHPPGDERTTPRIGWLIQQHPRIETAFRLSHIPASILMPNRALPHPVSMMWCSDDTPLPWHNIKLYKDEPDAEFLVMMKGYQTTQVGWTYTFSDIFSSKMMYSIQGHAGGASLKPDTTFREVWALLATINDLPVSIEHIEPSKGYIARGSYKKFLKHSIIHLNVPETRWRKLLLKTAQILRRRAHQVRGHWRKDWRRPLLPTCEHIFDDAVICRLCGGHKIFIHEHQRGDASLGFVTHDYEVHHDA